MFLNILLIAFILIGLSFLGLALNILVKKKGKFPAYRVGHNSDMAKLGLKCVKHEEIRCHKERLKNKEADDNCIGCQQLV
ncbi:hypothetical protein ACFLRQ_00055 [Bacteroidota bacterium]